MSALSELEAELLETMIGVRPAGPWGAWVTACLEGLCGARYVVQEGTHYWITDAGRAALAAYREKGDG